MNYFHHTWLLGGKEKLLFDKPIYDWQPNPLLGVYRSRKFLHFAPTRKDGHQWRNSDHPASYRCLC